MTLQGPGPCKACEQWSKDRTSGYCPPCWDEYRAMVDEWDARQRELDRMDEAPYWAQDQLDRESAESYAEYDLREDSDDQT